MRTMPSHRATDSLSRAMAALEAEHRSASRLLPRLEKPMKSSGSRQAVDSRRETGSTSGESVGPGQRAPEEEALRQPAAQAHGEGCDEEGMHLMPPPPPDPRAVVIEMLLVQGIPQAAAVRALRATDEAYSEAGIEQCVPFRSVGTVLPYLFAGHSASLPFCLHTLPATQPTQDCLS